MSEISYALEFIHSPQETILESGSFFGLISHGYPELRLEYNFAYAMRTGPLDWFLLNRASGRLMQRQGNCWS